jgi:hypothetical protein
VQAQEVMKQGKPVNRTAAIVIIGVWLLIAALVVVFVVRLDGK